MQRFAAYSSLLFTMLIWGVGPVAIRYLAVTLGAADTLVIRYALVAPLYLLGLAVLGGWRIGKHDWPRLMAVSLVGMVGYNLGSVFGFERVTAGVGGLIIGTQPILIALLAALLAREPLTGWSIAGLVLAFAGTTVLFWNDLTGANENGSFLLGGLLIFLSGTAWAVYVVLSRPLLKTYGTFPVTALTILIATVPIMALASATTFGTVLTMSSDQWLAMLYLAVPSTMVASVTWNFGAARLPASTTGSFLYLVPVIAVLAGALWFDEQITIAVLLGGSLILAGVALAQSGAAVTGSLRGFRVRSRKSLDLGQPVQSPVLGPRDSD